MVDEQPWWVIEQLPVVAKAWAEVEELQAERARAKAETDAARQRP